MASELGLLSSTQHQNFAHIHPQQSQPLIWNHKQMPQDEYESWEVRAFEQDSSNITWPPRSYTCTYCTREFRSAQALGGHMNVHRRDRARLHQVPHGSSYPTSTSLASPTFLVPSQEMVNTSGLCFVYSLSNPNGGLTPIGLSSCMKSPSNFASISPFVTNNLFPSCPSTYTSSIGEPSRSYNSESKNLECNGSMRNSAFEELDLELRLGRR